MSKTNSGPPPIFYILLLPLLGLGAYWFWSRVIPNIFQSTSSNNSLKNNSVAGSANFPNFNSVTNIPKGLFSYGGSSTWAPIRKEIDPLLQAVWPEFKLRYIDPVRGAPSSDTGITMLINNELEFSHSAKSLTDEQFAAAQKRGFTLKEVPVAIDGIAVVVHPSLNITGLTIAQYDAIASGAITNWQEVGGPNRKIQPYGKIGRDKGKHFILLGTTTEAIRKVSNDPGGIYWASAPLLIGQCHVKPLSLGRNQQQLIAPYKLPFIPLERCPEERNQVNQEVFKTGEYPLSRKLIVVIKKNGQIAEQAGEAYANLLLTDQGQELLEKAGFVKLR